MFSVFNADFLTDMGKTIVRKHLNTTDAQQPEEKRRLTQYDTNTVLDDNLKELLNSLCFILMSNLGNWMKFLMTVRNFHPL